MVPLCGAAVCLNFHPRASLKLAPSLICGLLFVSKAELLLGWISLVIEIPNKEVFWPVILFLLGLIVGKVVYNFLVAVALTALLAWLAEKLHLPFGRAVSLLSGIVGWFAQPIITSLYNSFRWVLDPIVGASLLALGCERFYRSAGLADGPSCGWVSMACTPSENPAVAYTFLAGVAVGLFVRFNQGGHAHDE